jgi:hypothetical protein
MKVTETTIVNEHGEKIHIRIIGKEISIHHEDASDEFVPISEFLCDTIINSHELIGIYDGIKKLVLQDF